MLPAASRMRRSADFEQAVRRGARSGTSSLVVHLTRDPDERDALVGFVVSKGVGNAVVRNRVKRRLRAAMHPRLGGIPVGGRIVVRALPPAADADFSALDRDLQRALSGAARRLEARHG